MQKRKNKFTRVFALIGFLPLLAVDVLSLDMAALNGVWTDNIMAVGRGARERNFSWGKGKFTSYGVIFIDLKKGVVGISEEGLFEIKDLKQEDANTVSMTVHFNPEKGEDNPSDLFSFWSDGKRDGTGVRSYFIRVHFENYNKIWLEMPTAYWGEGKDKPRYKMSGPPREMAGADFEPIESVFGERAGDFCYTVETTQVTITRYLNNAVVKEDIPSAIKGIPVKAIGYGAFAGCSNLKSVNIPRGVVRIEDHAFDGTGLTAIVIPDGVVNIGDAAFLGCTALTSVVISNSVTAIGLSAFADCVNLKSVVLPDSITSIKSGTFAGCSGLETITLPESVIDIDPSAFGYCSSLTSIVLPAGLSRIWMGAFEHCSSLASIELPASLSYIGPKAFQYCSNLKTITIPRGIKGIEPEMFRGCDNLISVKLFRGTGIRLDPIGGSLSYTENENFMKRVKIEYMN